MVIEKNNIAISEIRIDDLKLQSLGCNLVATRQ